MATTGDKEMTSSEPDLSSIGHLALLRQDTDGVRRTMETWLAAKLGSPVGIQGLSRPVGAGMSNDTFLFTANYRNGGQDCALDLVLRVHPDKIQLFLETNFYEQYQLLEAMHSTGLVRVAKPYWYEKDISILGQPFYVMEQLKGRVPVSFPPYNQSGFLFDATIEQRHRAWLSAVGELARVNRVPVNYVQFLARPQLGKTGFDQHFNYWVKSWEWARGKRHIDFLEETLEWLLSNRPETPLDGLSWGDARMGNMMFSDKFAIAGVMDWEQMSLGGAMTDLAWWTFFDDVHSKGMGLKRLDGLGNRQETIELWESLTGLQCADLNWHEVFAGFKVSVLWCRKNAITNEEKPGSNCSNNTFTRMLAERRGVSQPRDEFAN